MTSADGRYAEIRYDVAERVATITLDRPQARNAYTVTMADEIADALRRADTDEQVRVVLLTAAGPDFCVGMDLAPGSVAPAPGAGWVEPASRVCRPIFELSKPVVCATRGAAVGAGSTMQLPADIRLAADDARFGFVFARRGLYPEGGSMWFLPRLVGLSRATEWLVTGRLIPAGEALAAGLVHAVHPAEQLLERARQLAREIAETTAPTSVAVIRQALPRVSAWDSPQPAFDLDSRLIASCAGNPDTVEGIASFLQRRPPRFSSTVPADLPEFLPWRAPR